MLGESQHPVHITVQPSSYEHGGALDRLVVGARGAVEPVGVTLLMAEPLVRPLRRSLQAIEPLLVPTLAHDIGIRREAIGGHHRSRPVRLLGGVQRAAV
jgi:hypothetical protein